MGEVAAGRAERETVRDIVWDVAALGMFNGRCSMSFLGSEEMGILDKVGEIAGAVAAVEALEKVDPDAGLLTKAAAAVAGFEGAGAMESLVEKKSDNVQAATDDPQASGAPESKA